MVILNHIKKAVGDGFKKSFDSEPRTLQVKKPLMYYAITVCQKRLSNDVH